MTKLSLGTAITLGLLALASVRPAQATFVYVNPPDLSSNQDGDCVYNTVCGPDFTGNTYGAQEITLTSPATINTVGWNSIIFSASFATQANWLILNANGTGGLPGTLVTSGSGAPLSSTAGPNGTFDGTTDYSFSVGSVSLPAGSYYVAIQAVTSNISDYLSLGTAGSGAEESDDGGSTWGAGYGGAGREIDNVSVALCSGSGPCYIGLSPAPEPTTIALLGFGLLGVGIVRRRRGRLGG